jgi:hypothetical protein
MDYIKSSLAREVSLAGVWAIARDFMVPPKHGAFKRLTEITGEHVLMLNFETALTAILKYTPDKQPGKVVLVESTLAKKTEPILRRMGLSQVSFKGVYEFVDATSMPNIIAVIHTDRFDRRLLKTKKFFDRFDGLLVSYQKRKRFKRTELQKREFALWETGQLARASGGVVCIGGVGVMQDLDAIRVDQKALDRISATEFIIDNLQAIRRYVPSKRHVKRRPHVRLSSVILRLQKVY